MMGVALASASSQMQRGAEGPLSILLSKEAVRIKYVRGARRISWLKARISLISESYKLPLPL